MTSIDIRICNSSRYFVCIDRPLIPLLIEIENFDFQSKWADGFFLVING